MNRLLKIIIPVFSLLILVSIVGCAAPKQSASSPGFAPVPAPAPMSPSVSRDSAAEGGVNYGAAAIDETGIDRKIIMTGEITLEVSGIDKALDEVATLASDLGGYVVSSNKWGDDDRNSGRISIRVPANRFTEAFTKLRGLAVKVPYESTNSQDVTEEYMDLQARLHNLEATEAQFLALLEKAETVEDILNVQRELSNVRGEIERIKGRIQYLDRTTDMSLINVSLEETKTVGESKWDVLDIFKSAVNGLIQFGKVLGTIIIWLVIFIPLWIIIGVIVFFVRRRKKRAKSQ